MDVAFKKKILSESHQHNNAKMKTTPTKYYIFEINARHDTYNTVVKLEK